MTLRFGSDMKLADIGAGWAGPKGPSSCCSTAGRGASVTGCGCGFRSRPRTPPVVRPAAWREAGHPIATGSFGALGLTELDSRSAARRSATGETATARKPTAAREPAAEARRAAVGSRRGDRQRTGRDGPGCCFGADRRHALTGLKGRRGDHGGRAIPSPSSER